MSNCLALFVFRLVAYQLSQSVIAGDLTSY